MVDSIIGCCCLRACRVISCRLVWKVRQRTDGESESGNTGTEDSVLEEVRATRANQSRRLAVVAVVVTGVGTAVQLYN